MPNKRKSERAVLLVEQGGLCFWCGHKVDNQSLDHLVPKSRGGSSDKANKAVCCAKCNAEKGFRLPSEYVRYKLVNIERFLKSEGFKRYARR